MLILKFYRTVIITLSVLLTLEKQSIVIGNEEQKNFAQSESRFHFWNPQKCAQIAFWPEQQGIRSVCDESTKSVFGLLGSHFPIILSLLLSPFPFSVAVSLLFCCSHELLLKQTEQMSRECIALALCIGIAVAGFLLFTFQLKLAWRYISAWEGTK